MIDIDPVTLPILVKAIDFLFEEGKKILNDRRERRKVELSQSPDSAKKVPQDLSRASKEKALTTKVHLEKWKEIEDETDHLLSLLEVYKKNYYLAKEQYAKFGSALVPQIIVYNLEEAEDGIAITTEKLKTEIIKLYGEDILS